MSFGAEVKDFLNAYQAGQKISASQTDEQYKKTLMDATQKKTARDNDPDTLARADEVERAKLDNLRSQISSRNALTGARVKAYGAVNAGGGGMPGVAPEDANIGGDVAGAAQPFTPTVQQPQQGAVPAYATGGMVDTGDDDSDDDDVLNEPDTAAAAPTQAPQPAVGDTSQGNQPPTDISARSRQQPQGSLSGVSPQLVHDATSGGLTYGINAMGIGSGGGVRTRAQQEKALAYARGFGALPPAELDKVKKAVDPEGKLSDAQRNMAALGSVFQYQMNKGNPQGAQRAAFQVLQAYRLDSMRYASIAAHAAQDGNIDLATQAAVKAYANIPDGRDIHLTPAEDGRINYSYTDGATGKVIQKGLITPQELAAQATGLAKNGFDKAILSAAGQREAETNKKGNAGPKVGDVDKITNAAQGAVDDGIAGIEKDGTAISPDSKRMLGGTTMRLLKNNLGVLTPSEAFVASRDLLGNTNDDAFKIKKGDDGINVITFGPKSSLGAGYKIKMDDDALEPIIAQRASMLAAQKKKKDEEEDTGKRRADIVSRGGKALADVGSSAVDALKPGDDAPALKDDAPLAKAGRAIASGASAVKDGLRRVGAVDAGPLDYQGAQTP